MTERARTSGLDRRGAERLRRRSRSPDRGAGGGAIVAVEALLVVPGHLLAASIATPARAPLVNAGPRRERGGLSARASASIAALRALALVPLIRVVALALPMRDWSEPVAIIAVALPSGGRTAARARRRTAAAAPALPAPLLRGPVRPCLAGAALSLVAFRAGVPALWPDGAAGDRSRGRSRSSRRRRGASRRSCSAAPSRGRSSAPSDARGRRHGRDLRVDLSRCRLHRARADRSRWRAPSSAMRLAHRRRSAASSRGTSRSSSAPGRLAPDLQASDLPELREPATTIVLSAAIAVVLASRSGSPEVGRPRRPASRPASARSAPRSRLGGRKSWWSARWPAACGALPASVRKLSGARGVRSGEAADRRAAPAPRTPPGKPAANLSPPRSERG